MYGSLGGLIEKGKTMFLSDCALGNLGGIQWNILI